MVKNPYRAYKDRHHLTWAEVAAVLGISHGLARQLGCGWLRQVSDLRRRDFEARTGGELKARTLAIWAKQGSEAA